MKNKSITHLPYSPCCNRRTVLSTKTSDHPRKGIIEYKRLTCPKCKNHTAWWLGIKTAVNKMVGA